MTRIEYEYLHEDIEKSNQRQQELHRQQMKWDKCVRKALTELGDALWSRHRLLRLLPTKSFRLRSRGDEIEYYWWIEKDIPPHDRYRCAAYIVCMKMDTNLNPILVVRSGDRMHVVNQPDEAALYRAVEKAGREAPLITARHMGPAWD